MAVFVDSEIGKLKRVIVHTPGREVEAMTPESAEEVLYNEIVPVASVQREHATLKAVLEQVSEVHEFTELLARGLEDSEARSALVRAVSHYSHTPDREEELLALPAPELSRALVGGLRQKRNTLSAFLSERIYDIPPLPNLYFTRDGAAVFRDRVVFGRMAHRVRTLESLLLKTIFYQSPELEHRGVLFDGLQERSEGMSLEGGDLLIWDSHTILLGVSARTSSAAIDRVAENLTAVFQEEFRLLVVTIPETRATIHLDTVFTLIDRDLALVYEPVMLGANVSEAYRIICRPGETMKIERFPNVVQGLKSLGTELEIVPCGGTDPVRRSREQWLSAANAFAVAPGKILSYDCNEETLRSLESAGFTVASADDVLSGRAGLTGEGRVVVALPGVELARGGGGPRCMTLPVEREPFP